ncbi:MAG: LacI family transcriptional regulator [Bifidobacteriaceae bacterium]|jgi:DNA-binding LacI/PurR family transcriptional regulator|nr:LacI family transcriptional regulator [Bifidobacteriaceae bacterium]
MSQTKAKVTITDVARASGVSSSAVSYALNGKRGVSADTRDKVLKVARELGWKPNSAAKALSNSRSRNIGLIQTRDPKLFAVESYGMELIAGLGTELEKADYSLVIRQADGLESEMRILKDWMATGGVDGVILVNMELGDPRIELLEQNPQMPVLVLGDPSLTGGLPTLWSDDAAAAGIVVDYLSGLGHTSIVRVAGPEEMAHTFIRDRAFMEETTKRGITYSCLHTDYSPTMGAEITERFLTYPGLTSAIVYDSDAMALAGLGVAVRKGISVPRDLSIISWDDSFMCSAVFPSLTAIHRDVVASGAMAAKMILRIIDGEKVEPQEEKPYSLIERDSTGPAPTD